MTTQISTKAESYTCPKCGRVAVKELHFCTAPTPPAVTKEEGAAPSEPSAGLYVKEIVWDRETKDFAMYLDKELVGFARSFGEAEITLDNLVYELQASGLTRTATELDGGDPEHVEVIDPLAEEGRHEQLAQDMGGVWGAIPDLEGADLTEALDWAAATLYGPIDGGDPEQAGEGEYRAFIAADKAWSAELERLFGKSAGDIRYTEAGRSGPTLAPLYAEFRRACEAWHAEMEAPTPTELPPPEDKQASDLYAQRQRPCPECGKADCPGSAAEPAQSGLCWCVTWMAQGHAGKCPDCRWRAAQVPPPDATIEQIVELAYAMRHIPLPDEGRYGHRVRSHAPEESPAFLQTECAICYSLQPCQGGICVARTACERRQAENKTPVSRRVAGCMTGKCGVCGGIKPCHYNSAIEHWICDPCDAAGAKRLLDDILYTGPRCSECGDPSPSSPCPACRESGEARPHLHVNADVNGGAYKPEREAANALEAIAGDIGGVVAYVNGRLTIVDVE